MLWRPLLVKTCCAQDVRDFASPVLLQNMVGTAVKPLELFTLLHMSYSFLYKLCIHLTSQSTLSRNVSVDKKYQIKQFLVIVLMSLLDFVSNKDSATYLLFILFYFLYTLNSKADTCDSENLVFI